MAEPLPLRCPSCGADMAGGLIKQRVGRMLMPVRLSRWKALWSEIGAGANLVAWKCPECWHFERPRERGDG